MEFADCRDGWQIWYVQWAEQVSESVEMKLNGSRVRPSGNYKRILIGEVDHCRKKKCGWEDEGSGGILK
jgi:hypothetical protein